ncbi:MAG: methionyl-tRNA formyltransferase [Treponema sp.]|nr:methionyl-tRNA formyltransferase [Treponema sp.]
MRILFAASPVIAVPSLKIISQMEGVSLVGVLTNPDSRRGRHNDLIPTDISAALEELNIERKSRGQPSIPQLKPVKLNAAARDEVSGLNPDLLVSFAYGHIFGPRFLSLFPLGGINIHPSLLPKYRGAAPIPAAILNREEETGITIQLIAPELDSGDILAVECITLSGKETAASLSETVSIKAASLLGELLPDFHNKVKSAKPQKGTAVYCKQMVKEDGLIDWSRSAIEIEAKIRAYTPWPLCFTFRGKDRLFILEAQVSKGDVFERKTGPGTVLGKDGQGVLIQTGEGVLSVSKLQLQAKKALDWKSFLNGERNFIGLKLGV